MNSSLVYVVANGSGSCEVIASTKLQMRAERKTENQSENERMSQHIYEQKYWERENGRSSFLAN